MSIESEEPNQRYPNLGKLSIAILEHLVEKTIGQAAIDELKKPYAKAQIVNLLGQALSNVEKDFIDQFKDQDISYALLQLPIHNLPSVLEEIWNFYNRPNDHRFEILLIEQLSTIKTLTKDQIKSAVNFYMKLLKRELINFSPEFLQKVMANAILDLADAANRDDRGSSDVKQRSGPASATPKPTRKKISEREPPKNRVVDIKNIPPAKGCSLNVQILLSVSIITIVILSGYFWLIRQPHLNIIPTSTNLIATSTHQMPTNTLLLYPTASLTQTLMAPIFFDTFDNNTRNHWKLPDSSGGAYVDARIVGGKLTLVIECPLTYPGFFCNPYMVVPNYSGNNFNLSFDASLEKLSDRSANASIDIMFRYKFDNYYDANYNFDGLYFFEIYFQGKPTTIQSGNIKLESDLINRIGLSAQGYNFNMIANDQSILVEDGNITNPGIMSIYFLVYKGSKVKITIDNLYIYPVVP